MNRIVVTSRVGSDGVVRLALPVGVAEAGREIEVTVEPAQTPRSMPSEQWAAWVDSMAGAWKGDFERPPQDWLQ